MGKAFTITVTDDQQAQLEALASETNESVEVLAGRAVIEYLEYDRAFRQAVQVGVDDAQAGRDRDLADVARDLRARVVQTQA